MAANGNSKPTVTVAGGGIAGIAAALRLGQTGEYEVTLYEEKNVLGGNLASGLSQHVAKFQPLGVVEPEEILDVYPHMYQAWYVNFWQLLKDAGVKGVKLTEAGTPEELDGFVRFSEFHQLSRRDAGVRGKQPAKARIRTLVYPYSARYVLQNLASGLAPPADLFAAGYAGLDLQAERMNPTIRLQNTSLTGYLNSRMYMSRAAIAAYETLISTVWGIPAYLISAADYRTYSGYCYGAAEEDSWLTNGPAIEAFMARKSIEESESESSPEHERHRRGVRPSPGQETGIRADDHDCESHVRESEGQVEGR
jgi:hypothetical protein